MVFLSKSLYNNNERGRIILMKDLHFDEIFAQQTRSTKQNISDETIDKVRCVSIDEFDDEELLLIQQLHKRLLKHSKEKNDSNEVGILVDLIDWSDILIEGDENSISLKSSPDAKMKMETAPKNSLLFLHNHPRNTCFSEIDLSSFLTADPIYLMAVVGNNGRQYFLIKLGDFDKGRALEYYDELFENAEGSSVKEFLRTCRKVGLRFIYGGE